MRYSLTIVAMAVASATFLLPSLRARAEATVPKAIAVVLGKEITPDEKPRLTQLILGPIFEKYASENKVQPSDDELDIFIEKLAQKEKQHEARMQADKKKLLEELKSKSLSDRDREEKSRHLETIENILKTRARAEATMKGREEEMRPMKRQMAQQFVKRWKINKSLYEKYGGRVIFQQAGVEPIDAYRDFLREQEKKGAFQILDPQAEAEFWPYFTNDAMHTFLSEEEGKKFITTPWWMIEEPPKE